MHPEICIHIRIDLNTAPLNCHDLRKLIFHFIVVKVEASDGTEAFNLLVAAVNSADERVKLSLV